MLFKRFFEHCFLMFSADGNDLKELAQDFWPWEKLWQADAFVRWRWIKLCWVYFAVALFQFVIPWFVLIVGAGVVRGDVPGHIQMWLTFSKFGIPLMTIFWLAIEFIFPSKPKS